MWAAHALTCSRLAFAIAFWRTYGDAAWSLAWVVLAAASDALDGRVARWARRRAGVSERAPGIGDWLDPAADKLFVVIVLVTVGAHEQAWPQLACIGARELALIPVLAAYAIARALGRARSHALRARPIGKVATAIQFVAVVALVAPGADAARWPLAIAAGVLGLAAVIDQLVRD